MKLVLMVHQFGTPGEERGRLPVMNVLFGHYCTQQQIPASHTGPPYWPPPRMAQSLRWPHGVSRASEESNHISHSLTVKPTECQWVFGEDCDSQVQCVLVEYVQRHLGGPSLLTLLLS